MVVVSGGWLKNAQYLANYGDLPVNEDDMETHAGDTKMSCAKAVLSSRPNSHPFQERVLSLQQPIKVGRAVARARATPTNAIFDCKVLSRHHALLWYYDGKFFLQDTKSSNGTFVNNNKLSTAESDPLEVNSGDIVQFGVDVLENNRKVTHGCIIATLKLYLPDGKEAKASPCLTEGSRQGMVPLDELYKLNQIIQEASQREQCLESKLAALQHVVETARRATDENWQVYVGEERLLSHVAVLEMRLAQANKTFGDDHLRDELGKLQEDRMEYQVAAKEALRKLHAERLDAVATAAEQQRARATAEQEVMVIKVQLVQAQFDLKEIAQKLEDEQRSSEEERAQLEQKEQELQARLITETRRVNDLQRRLDVRVNFERIPILERDDENDDEELVKDETGQGDAGIMENGVEQSPQNHINLTVAPVTELLDNTKQDVDDETVDSNSTQTLYILDDNCFTENKDELNKNKEGAIEATTEVSEDQGEESESCPETESVSDTRTLRYQYQSTQNELRKQIEQLEILSTANKTKIALLEKSLMNEKEDNLFLTSESELLKEQFAAMEHNYLLKMGEWKELRGKVYDLEGELEATQKRLDDTRTTSPETNECASQIDAACDISVNQFRELEEELVLLKERYAVVNEEKVGLNRDLHSLHGKYNALCDRSHNTLFFYVGPLVIMVLYLLVSSMFS